MSQLIGKKSKEVDSGYVWAPYIMVDSIPLVSSPGFPGAKMTSRYQNPKIKKIKKILEKIEDLNITSS
jgi:hypothetical protein